MPIAEWFGTLTRLYPDSTKNEQGRCQIELKLTKKGLTIVTLEMIESYYTFELCAKAATSWITNNPGEPDHAIKIVNDTLMNYRRKVEAKGDSFIVDMKDYRPKK